MVRTDVIHDALDPRWMPWCTRAFCFNINHPSSILLLGVFDYDTATDHDPVGRVVVNMANFQSNTSYLLRYALHDDPLQNDVCFFRCVMSLSTVDFDSLRAPFDDDDRIAAQS